MDRENRCPALGKSDFVTCDFVTLRNMKHYQSSRGWRNNNPLNIRRGEQWSGLCAQQTDKVFCQFLNMTWGYRAAAKVLKSYARILAQQGQVLDGGGHHSTAGHRPTRTRRRRTSGACWN